MSKAAYPPRRNLPKGAKSSLRLPEQVIGSRGKILYPWMTTVGEIDWDFVFDKKPKGEDILKNGR